MEEEGDTNIPIHVRHCSTLNWSASLCAAHKELNKNTQYETGPYSFIPLLSNHKYAKRALRVAVMLAKHRRGRNASAKLSRGRMRS